MHACVCLRVCMVCLVNVQGHRQEDRSSGQPGRDLLELGVHARMCVLVWLCGKFSKCARPPA